MGFILGHFVSFVIYSLYTTYSQMITGEGIALHNSKFGDNKKKD